MQIRLPFVFEVDYLVRGGSKRHRLNMRSGIDVDIQRVDGLDERIAFRRPSYRIAVWEGRLYRSWALFGGDPITAQENVDHHLARRAPRFRGGQQGRRIDPPASFPVPPYMRTRRMRFADPTSSRFQQELPLPLTVKVELRHAKDERAEEARSFYERSFLISGGCFWMLAEEPVWQLEFARTAELSGLDPDDPPIEAYKSRRSFAPDFRFAYRQFRLDRHNDAFDFVCQQLESSSCDIIPRHPNAPEVLRRDDITQLAACTLEFLEPDLDGSLDLSDLFRGEPRAIKRAIERARSLVAGMEFSEVPLRDWPKFHLLRERWAFEDALERARAPHPVAAPEPDTTPELGDLTL